MQATYLWAGRISPDKLADEAHMHVQGGYRALKLRVGDTPLRDIHRVRAVREALGEGIEIMVDANYRLFPRGCTQGHASIRRLRRFLVGVAFSCTRQS